MTVINGSEETVIYFPFMDETVLWHFILEIWIRVDVCGEEQEDYWFFPHYDKEIGIYNETKRKCVVFNEYKALKCHFSSTLLSYSYSVTK